MKFQAKKELLRDLQKVEGALRYFELKERQETKLTNSMSVTFYNPGPPLKPEEISPTISRILAEFKEEVRQERIAKARKILEDEGDDIDGDFADYEDE